MLPNLSGERQIKMYDRDGNLILSFNPPGTTSSNRIPSYIAVDANGRVFVSDNYNNVINIFDADGKFIDSIIGRDMTLSKFVTRETGSPPPPGTEFFYDNINKIVVYQLPDEEMQVAHAPENEGWLPLGLRFDPAGNLLVTNLEGGKHGVVVIPAESLNGPLTEYAPQLKEFGAQGDGDGELSFPNSAVTSSQGNFYVSDGNNSRVSVWSPEMQYQSVIGKGTAESALSLPRGLWMANKDHLHVVDTVGQLVKVFDVSGAEPVFLYSFGEFGNEQGQFNFPSDIYHRFFRSGIHHRSGERAGPNMVLLAPGAFPRRLKMGSANPNSTLSQEVRLVRKTGRRSDPMTNRLCV